MINLVFAMLIPILVLGGIFIHLNIKIQKLQSKIEENNKKIKAYHEQLHTMFAVASYDLGSKSKEEELDKFLNQDKD